MTTPIAIVLAIIAIMSISFFLELLPLGFTALMVPVLLQGAGILEAKDAWSGFSDTTVITWIGMFIIWCSFLKDKRYIPDPHFYPKKHQGQPCEGFGCDYARYYGSRTDDHRHCHHCRLDAYHFRNL